MSTVAYQWPDIIQRMNNLRDPAAKKKIYDGFYPIPGLGDLVGVTTFLDIIGTGKPYLLDWTARCERAATIEASWYVYQRTTQHSDVSWAEAIENRLGPAQRHQAELEKAADVGKQIHD